MKSMPRDEYVKTVMEHLQLMTNSKGCVACGNTEFLVKKKLLLLSFDRSSGISVVPVSCQSCGHFEFYESGRIFGTEDFEVIW